MYGTQYPSHNNSGGPGPNPGFVPQPKPVGVFWDIENCSLPKGLLASEVVNSIRHSFIVNRLNHREYEFLIACDITKLRKDIATDITKSGGVTLAHVPGESKNAADEKLRESMRRFVDTHGSLLPMLILISGDIDFVNDLRGYQTRLGCHIVVLHGPTASPHFKQGWNEMYAFKEFLTKIPPREGQDVNKNGPKPQEATGSTQDQGQWQPQRPPGPPNQSGFRQPNGMGPRPRNFPPQPRNFPQQPRNFSQQPRNFPQQPRDFPQQPRDFPQQSRDFPQQSRDFPQQSRDFPKQQPNTPFVQPPRNAARFPAPAQAQPLMQMQHQPSATNTTTSGPNRRMKKAQSESNVSGGPVFSQQGQTESTNQPQRYKNMGQGQGCNNGQGQNQNQEQGNNFKPGKKNKAEDMPPNQGGGGKPNIILMVSGLPGKMDYRILKDHLQDYAGQVAGKVMYVHNGQAFITFKRQSDADRAIELFNGREVYGKTLNIQLSKTIPFQNPRPGMGGPPAQGQSQPNQNNQNIEAQGDFGDYPSSSGFVVVDQGATGLSSVPPHRNPDNAVPVTTSPTADEWTRSLATFATTAMTQLSVKGQKEKKQKSKDPNCVIQ